MLIKGSLVNKSDILSAFMSAVQTPFMTDVNTATPAPWSLSNKPWSTVYTSWAQSNKTNGNHQLLGPSGQPALTYPSSWPNAQTGESGTGNIATTNVFFILHGFALALTRHRRAHAWILRGNPGSTNNAGDTGSTTRPLDLGVRLTSYAVNNVVWFDYPSMPAPGATITNADINTFLSNLKTQIETIRDSTTSNVADIVACHLSCHSACHGSRGRR
ncbi:MAG: hypothetical protein ACK41T_00265 [Pseudobdellovibrio sp.]